jgi:ABC-type nitrate/sulfonate/bicarbonate transport system permease component
MSNRYSVLLPLAGPLLLISLWVMASLFVRVNPLLVPTPSDAASRFISLLLSAPFWSDALATGQRWVGGYAIGCAVGIPIGLMIGASRIAFLSLNPLVDFLRSIPVTVLFPLFLLVFGIGDASKWAMAFSATVFVVIVNTSYGVLHASALRRRMAKAFGATRLQIFFQITFFEALPHSLIGCRTALSLALIVVIVAEMFIWTEHGIGQRVFNSYSRNVVSDIYAVILFVGAVGFAANRGFLAIERRLVFWASSL